jgi:sodium-independent sulfate anion transporter 11
MFFGTSKDVTLGPTAIMSLLTISIIDPDNQLDPYERVPLAILLTLLSGLVQFALGILNLGFLIDFIPRPVISGFTSAAAITIAFGQVKSLFGVTVKVRRQFIYCVYDTIKAVVNMNWM